MAEYFYLEPLEPRNIYFHPILLNQWRDTKIPISPNPSITGKLSKSVNPSLRMDTTYDKCHVINPFWLCFDWTELFNFTYKD